MAQGLLLDVPSVNPTAPPGETPSWFTPLQWWEQLEAQLMRSREIPRQFDLDPFGHPNAPVTWRMLERGALTYFGMRSDDDGLAVPWAGKVVFANPPYDAATMEAAMRKIAAEVSRADAIVALVPAWTDRAWWHSTVEPARLTGAAVVRFVPGRLRFGWPANPEAFGADGAMFPSAVVTWVPRCACGHDWRRHNNPGNECVAGWVPPRPCQCERFERARPKTTDCEAGGPAPRK